MTRFPRVQDILWLVLACCSISVSVRGQDAADPAAPFRPAEWFPAGCQLYLRGDLAALNTASAECPLGSIAMHPGVRRALGKMTQLLEAQVEQGLAEFEREVGVPVEDILQQLDGEFALGVRLEKTVVGMPFSEAFLVVALRGDPTEGLGTVRRILEKAAPQLQYAPQQVGGHEVVNVTYPGVPFAVRMGLHGRNLYVAFTNKIDQFLARVDGESESRSLSADEGFARAAATGKPDSLLDAYIDLGASSKILLAFLPLLARGGELAPEDIALVRDAYKNSGVLALSSLWFQTRFDDGDFADVLRLESLPGFQGYFADIAAHIGPPADTSGLEKVPARATSVLGMSLDKGGLIDALFERTAGFSEESAAMVESVSEAIQAGSGLSVKDDLAELPRLDLIGFELWPRHGDVMPDYFWVGKLDQIAPWLQVLDRFVRKIGSEPRSIEVGDETIAYFEIERPLASFGISPSTGPLIHLPDDAKLLMTLFDRTVRPSFAVLDEEHVLIAYSPRAIERYLTGEAGQPKHGARTAVAGLAGFADRPADAAFCWMNGGQGALVAYNTLVDGSVWATPFLEDIRKQYEVDATYLPPAEQFADKFRPGTLYSSVDETTWTLRGHRVLTNALPAILPPAVLLGIQVGLIAN